MSGHKNIDFHKFIDSELKASGYRIVNVTAEMIQSRLRDFMEFVNSIVAEYGELYKWKPADEGFFLNPMVDKWKYSFAVLDNEDKIHFLNFSSVYNDHIHNHCTFAGKMSRGKNFAKLHIIKLCQTGIDNGFTYQEGYWPKNNNGSIILFLKMGWQISHIRNDMELGMKADLVTVRNRTYDLVKSSK